MNANSMMKFLKMSGLSLFLAAGTSLVLGGCATAPKSGAGATGGATGGATSAGLREVESFRVSDPEPPRIADEELDEIPVEINPKVEQWIRYFQGRGRPHMERYLSRSSRYSKLMKRILRENGLPEDLIYIALIESGFNQKATSHASAVGYWQFIRGTGKRYGLEINALVDERRDPVLSTQAAAEYYKGLYSIFGSWYLAMASYNVGENRVMREITKHKTRDFWELTRKRRLPKETMNYVPKYIAAKLIGNDPAKYGFTEIDWEPPIEFELVRIDNPVNLRVMSQKMGLDYEDFKQINPKFRGEIAPTKTSGMLELRIPLGQQQVALNAARESIVDKVEFIADAGETQIHRVRRGDSLYTIARKYKTTVGWIREVNDLGGRRKLRIGQRLQVPDRSRRKTPEVRTIVAKREASAPSQSQPTAPSAATAPAVTGTPAPTSVEGAGLATAKTTASEAPASTQPSVASAGSGGADAAVAVTQTALPFSDGEIPAGESPTVSPEAIAQEPASSKTEIVTDKGVYYVVQPGDSLYSIAQEYDSTVSELRKMNKIKRGRVLKVGARLLVPKDERLPEEPDGEAKPDANARQTPAEDESGEAGPETSLDQSSRTATGAALAPAAGTIRPVAAASHRPASVPSARTHVVRQGDSLFRIARRYKVSMKAIQTHNGLRSAGELSIGRRLVIPE